MCLIETKIYTHPDGHREIIETTRPCPRATSTGLCYRVERRTVEQHARLIERRPAPDRRDSDGLVVTEGRDGTQRIYRDITRRSSIRNSNRSRANTSKRSSLETPSSAPTASYAKIRPEAPSPPKPLSPGQYQAPPAAPYMSGGMSGLNRTVGPDGTAIYGSPPSLDLPRARENERHARTVEPQNARRQSNPNPFLSSRDPIPAPSSSTRPHRRSVRISTPVEDSSPSAGSPSSPGLSQLPKIDSARHDSAQDFQRPGILRRESERDHAARLQREEDERQAELERGRLAESERRQEARRKKHRAARDVSQESRERHRREAVAALEGKRRGDDRLEQLEAEYAQMARERAAAEQRSRDSHLAERMHEANEKPPREIRAQNYQTRTSPRSSRRMTNGNYAPFTSSPLRPAYSVQVHNPPSSSRRNSDAIRQTGEDVIAGEQARLSGAQRASHRLSAVILQEDTYAIEDGYELERYYADREFLQERRQRHRRREAENERFWR